MNVVNLGVAGAFYSDGKLVIPHTPMGAAKALYAGYTVISTLIEMGSLATAASTAQFDSCFHGVVSEWERYQLIIFLWAQSSVANTIGGMLTLIFASAAYRTKEESIDNSQEELNQHHSSQEDIDTDEERELKAEKKNKR